MTQHTTSRFVGITLMFILLLGLAVSGDGTVAYTTGAVLTASKQTTLLGPAQAGSRLWLPLVRLDVSLRTGAYARTTTTLNLRAGPSTNDAILLVLPAGAYVYVIAGPYHSIWYQVTYNGTTGYVHGGYLTQDPPQATDRLPDLGMARLRDLYIQTTADGRRLLRFSTLIVNVGAGPFEVRGRRPDTSTSQMTTTQRIYHSAGGFRDVPTRAVMYYSGDGHNHWHVRDLQRYELVRLDNGAKVGTGAKHGFCFYDNYRHGATTNPVYTTSTNPPACGRLGDLRVTMGLTVGWGDMYFHNLRDQYIDITGLGAGRYRLWATADPARWFQETNDANNTTWVDIQVQGTSVRITDYGLAAEPVN